MKRCLLLLALMTFFGSLAGEETTYPSFDTVQEEVHWIDGKLEDLRKQWLRERRHSKYYEEQGDRIYWRDSGQARHSYRRSEFFRRRMLDTDGEMEVLKARRTELMGEKYPDPVESL